MPVDFETLGAWGHDARKLFTNIGKKILIFG